MICLFTLVSTAPAAAAGPAVEPAYVTVIAVIPPGGQTNPDFHFQMGDSITLTGTNTGSDLTYLFITGPGLAANGSQIQSARPADSPVVEGDASSFATARVGTGGSWSWDWDTRNSALDPGTYKIYVVTGPHTIAGLEKAPYGTTSVTLVKPGSAETTTQPATTTVTTPVPQTTTVLTTPGQQTPNVPATSVQQTKPSPVSTQQPAATPATTNTPVPTTQKESLPPFIVFSAIAGACGVVHRIGRRN